MRGDGRNRGPIDAAVQSLALVAAEVLAEMTTGMERDDAVDGAAGSAFWAGFQAAAAFCAGNPDRAAALYQGIRGALASDPLADEVVTANVAQLLEAVELETATPRRLT